MSSLSATTYPASHKPCPPTSPRCCRSPTTSATSRARSPASTSATSNPSTASPTAPPSPPPIARSGAHCATTSPATTQPGILGEEEGQHRADAEFVWVLDPIDGTKSFATGNPLFGTLIGLLHRSTPVVGILEAPALGKRWAAAHGLGATHQNQPIRVRPHRALADSVLYSHDPRPDERRPGIRAAAPTGPVDQLRRRLLRLRLRRDGRRRSAGGSRPQTVRLVRLGARILASRRRAARLATPTDPDAIGAVVAATTANSRAPRWPPSATSLP
ncbi:MAG: hypothetical protein IPK26_22400 [Planctomycetes bacterium]|nr:hypothetical protein [Planctomycetota bacterium]